MIRDRLNQRIVRGAVVTTTDGIVCLVRWALPMEMGVLVLDGRDVGGIVVIYCELAACSFEVLYAL